MKKKHFFSYIFSKSEIWNFWDFQKKQNLLKIRKFQKVVGNILTKFRHFQQDFKNFKHIWKFQKNKNFGLEKKYVKKSFFVFFLVFIKIILVRSNQPNMHPVLVPNAVCYVSGPEPKPIISKTLQLRYKGCQWESTATAFAKPWFFWKSWDRRGKIGRTYRKN